MIQPAKHLNAYLAVKRVLNAKEKGLINASVAQRMRLFKVMVLVSVMLGFSTVLLTARL